MVWKLFIVAGLLQLNSIDVLLDILMISIVVYFYKSRRGNDRLLYLTDVREKRKEIPIF